MRFIFLILLVSFLVLPPLLLYSQELAYDYLIELGKEKFREGKYEEATHYFQSAQSVDSSSREPLYYLNLIKRIREGRLLEGRRKVKRTFLPRDRLERKKIIREKLKELQEQLKKPEAGKKYTSDAEGEELSPEAGRRRPSVVSEELEEVSKKRVKARPLLTKDNVVHLSSQSLEDFPLTVEISPGDFFIVNSPLIKRFLIVSGEVIDIEKLDDKNLKVNAQNLGSTFLHVWDQKGRWTFNIKVVPLRVEMEKESLWEKPESIKFAYSNDWRSYYRGGSIDTMQRDTITFDQWASMRGPIPYGEMDASLNWSKFGEESKITGYTVGITEGNFLTFNDFHLRGFDFTRSFSPLSFPGETLKGIFLESPAFNENIEYIIFHGKEKQYYYSFLSPGITTEEDSYVDGYRIRFFPHAKNNFALNYAHAYGEGREDYLKSKVFSFQSEHNLDKWSIFSEVASDEYSMAANLSSVLRLQRLNLRLSFRDIEPEFVTITGRPSGIGEIGGIIGFDWYPSENLSLSSNLDVYRDRYFSNPGSPDELNFEWDSYLDWRLGTDSNLTTSVYYINTPGSLSPQRNLNATSIYNKRFNLYLWGEKPLYTYLGYNYQKSINPLSPTSDYRKDAILSGLRLQLTPGFYCYSNYTYSWLEELEEAESSSPRVMETGFDFYNNLTPSVYSNVRFYYRDEQRASSLHSFLSGEDSLEGNINLTYSPYKDMEFYLDGRIRNVWAETEDAEAFIEAEVRVGTRLAWDSFFRFAPVGVISGVVFKDIDGDGLRGEDEKGIEGVKIIAGPFKAETDTEGMYKLEVKAKTVRVKIDLSTLPEGYVMTTNSSREINTSHGESYTIDFGAYPQSGIYGVAFYDKNSNNRLDSKDEPVPGIKITLPSRDESTRTNAEGVFFFSGMPAGEYKVKLDINSIPLEYLPMIPLEKVIEISEGFTYTYNIPLRKKPLSR
ncbi:MAG: hypothetical protein GF375_00655 [Candidatus Omnitrophica bacterium]|nr:hypothetical protein [Candidatus Omnitrophota bacterium]MBD3268669.1 hypothetical protein [Candidatus Omnitrophota bacterium]